MHRIYSRGIQKGVLRLDREPSSQVLHRMRGYLPGAEFKVVGDLCVTLSFPATAPSRATGRGQDRCRLRSRSCAYLGSGGDHPIPAVMKRAVASDGLGGLAAVSGADRVGRSSGVCAPCEQRYVTSWSLGTRLVHLGRKTVSSSPFTLTSMPIHFRVK